MFLFAKKMFLKMKNSVHNAFPRTNKQNITNKVFTAIYISVMLLNLSKFFNISILIDISFIGWKINPSSKRNGFLFSFNGIIKRQIFENKEMYGNRLILS